MFIYLFWERERACKRAWGRVNERRRNRVPRSLQACHHRARCRARTQTVRSWPELKLRVGCLTGWPTQAPPAMWFLKQSTKKFISTKTRIQKFFILSILFSLHTISWKTFYSKPSYKSKRCIVIQKTIDNIDKKVITGHRNWGAISILCGKYIYNAELLLSKHL